MMRRRGWAWLWVVFLALLPEGGKAVGGADFLEAVRNGECDKARAMLQGDPKLVDVRTEDDNTPLHLAAFYGETTMARLLLEWGASVNLRGARGETPLHVAAASGRLELAELLLAAKAEINATNLAGETPLHLAARKGQRAMLQALLDNAADPELRDQNGRTPAAAASDSGHGELAVPLTPRLGELGNFDRLAFVGAKAFSAEALREGLRATPALLGPSHPLAPREVFLRTLERQLLLGYLHQGFVGTKVSARTDLGAKRLVVTLEEGLPYLCGPVKVSGATGELASAIVECLGETNQWDQSGSRAYEFLDTAPPSTNGWSRSVAFVCPEVSWSAGQPAPLAELDLDRMKARMLQVLRDQGFLSARVHVQAHPEAASHTVPLQVEVMVGARSTVGSIRVAGAVKNSREALLDYLQLRPGLALTLNVFTNWEDKLWHSARFLAANLSLGEPDDAGRTALTLSVVEYQEAPPLNQPLSASAQTALKLRDWLAKLDESEEDLILTLAGVLGGSSELDLILSSRRGFAVLTRDLSASEEGRLQGLVLSPGQVAFYPAGSGRRLELGIRGIRPAVSLEIAPNQNEDAEDRPFNLSIKGTLESNPAGSAIPFRQQLSLWPVAVLGFLFGTNSASYISQGVLIRSNASGVFKIDAATGRLLEYHNEPDDSTPLGLSSFHRVKIRPERGAFQRSVEVLEARAGKLPNAYSPKAPLSSVLAYAVQQLLASRRLEYQLRSNGVSIAACGRLQALFRQLDLQAVFAPADAILAGAANREKPGPEFAVPRPPINSAGTLQDMVASTAPSLLPYVARVFSARSWPGALAQEALLAFAGKTEYTFESLEAMSQSAETGPLGCWTIASLARSLNPKLARQIAGRGLDRLSAKDFRRDWRLLFEGDSFVGRLGPGFAAALRGLDEDACQTLAQTRSIPLAAFCDDCVQRLREHSAEPAFETLAPVLDAWWETGLRTAVTAALKRLTVDADLAVRQGAAYLSGSAGFKDAEKAAQLFRQAAELDHPAGQFMLGRLYETGEGVTRSFAAALEWYTKSANQGFGPAAMVMGDLYSDGLGVKQDLIEALAWYRVAAGAGQELAENRCQALERKLTPDQIAQAQAKAQKVAKR